MAGPGVGGDERRREVRVARRRGMPGLGQQGVGEPRGGGGGGGGGEEEGEGERGEESEAVRAREAGEQERVARGGQRVEQSVVERRGGRGRGRVGVEQARGVAQVPRREHAQEQRLQAALPAAEQARVQPLGFLHGRRRCWQAAGGAE